MYIDDAPRGLRVRCHPYGNPERAGTIYAISKRVMGLEVASLAESSIRANALE